RGHAELRQRLGVHGDEIRLERGETALRRLRRELARVETELLEHLRVLVVIDLLGKLLDGLLHVLVLPGLLELLENELLVELHVEPPMSVTLPCGHSRKTRPRRPAQHYSPAPVRVRLNIGVRT